MRRNLRVTQALLGQLKGQGQLCEGLHVHRVLWTVGYLRQHCDDLDFALFYAGLEDLCNMKAGATKTSNPFGMRCIEAPPCGLRM